MATTLPVVVDVTAKNDGKAAAAIGELNKGVDRFGTAADRMAKSLDQVLRRLQQMETAGAQAGQASARSLEQAASAAERAAQREIAARRVAAAEARNSLQAEAQARQAARDAEIRAESEKRAARRASAAASREAAGAEREAAASAAKSAQEAVRAAKEQAAASNAAAEAAKELRAKVESSTQGMAVGLAAATVAVGGITAAVLGAANEFEVLLTRLQTVQGSAVAANSTFQRSVEFAGKTPFDLKGVVDATVTLEVYGQKSEQVLPRVAALAAGMGKDLQATALVVGKAMSGSLEGFESLRNEYGITTRELKRYGAETLKTGGILAQTAGQTEKARNALTKIIDLRFGDALERQSRTLSGQIEKVRDEVTTLAAEVGTGAAAVVKLAVGPISGFLSLVRQIPEPIKAIAGGAMVVATAVTGMAAAGTAAAAGLLALNTQLTAAATVMPALAGAAAASTTALGAMSTVLDTLSRLGAALTGPLGLALGAVTALGIGFGAAANQQEALGRAIAEESRQVQDQVHTYRQLVDAINKANGAKRGEANFVEYGAGRAETAEQFRQAFDTLPAERFREALHKAGIPTEELRKLSQAYRAEVTETDKKIADLQETERRLAQARAEGTASYAQGQRLDVIDDQIAALVKERAAQQARAEAVAQTTAEYEKQTVDLEAFGKIAQRTQDVLKYSDGDKSVQALTNSYGYLQRQISAAATELTRLNQPTDRESLIDSLRSGIDDEDIRGVVTGYLDLLEEADKRQKDLNEKRDEGPKQQLAQLRESLAEEKAVRKVSHDEVLRNLAEQMEVAKTLTKGRETEMTRILREEAQERAAIRKEDGERIKNALGEHLTAARTLPVSARSKGSGEDNRGTAESVAAYDKAIAKVEAYLERLEKVRASQAKLGADARVSAEEFKKLGQQGQEALDQLQIARAADEAQRLARNLSEFKKDFQTAFQGSENQGPAAQLLVVEDAITKAKAAQARGSIETKAADQELADLGRQRLQLEQTISQEKLRQAGEINALEQAAIQQEIDLLELRKEQGFAVDAEILAKTEELHAKKLESLKNELDQALEAAQDNLDAQLHAQEVYNRKVDALEKERTTDFEREHVKRTAIETGKSRQSRPTQGGSSASAGTPSQPSGGQTGPGSSQPYSSGIKASGFGTRDEYLAKRAERADPAAQNAAFDRANPGLLSMIRAQEVARQQADAKAQAAQRAPGKATQEAAIADAAKRQQDAIAAQDVSGKREGALAAVLAHRNRFGSLARFGDPSVPADLAAKADQVTRAGSAPAPTEAGAKAEQSAARSSETVAKTVVNNTYTLTASMEGGGFADISNDPKAREFVIGVFEEKFQLESYRDGGQGTWP